MILTEQRERIVEKYNVSDDDSIQMGIDEQSTHLLMQFLSKNIYSDGIGSVIRETVSNAIDSNVKAGNPDATIYINLKRLSEKYFEYSVKDSGVGLDQDDVNNIISKYMKSTKRNDNQALGSFGLGFKSPLAISDNFMFIGIKDGMKRTWMMYKDETTNKVDLLTEEPTEETNGVEVLINIANTRMQEFNKKLNEQLVYFKNLEINMFGNIWERCEFYETDLFKYSPDIEKSDLHICFQDVYYPIDWAKLDMKAISVPIGIKIALDEGVTPTINRETLMMSVETQEIIKDKIKKIADWFVTNYNDSVTEEFDTFLEAYPYVSPDYYIVDIGGDDLKINSLVKYSNIEIKHPSVKDISILPLSKIKSCLNFEEDLTQVMVRKYAGSFKYNNWFNTLDIVNNSKECVIVDNRVNIAGHYRSYLQSLGYKRYFKKSVFPIAFHYYNRNLELSKYEESLHESIIREYEFAKKSFIDNITNMSTSSESEEFLEFKKVKRARASLSRHIKYSTYVKKEEGKFYVEEARNSLRGYRDVVFDKKNISESEVIKHNRKSIIFTKEEKEKAKEIFTFFQERKRVIIATKKDVEKLEKIKNTMIFAKCNKGKVQIKEFNQIATALLFSEIIEKCEYLENSCDSDTWECINNSEIENAIEKINDYCEIHTYSGSSELAEIIVKKAEETNSYDKNLWNEYILLKEFVSNFNFISLIRGEKKGGSRLINEILLMKKLKFPEKYANFDIIVQEKEPIVEEEI